MRTWGNDANGSTVFLVGAYEHLSDISDRLLRALPPVLSISRAEWEASRASLARRFRDVVGEPPMTCLKNWRMALAADLLCESGQTVGTVAEKVGYATPFAFSTAFKRVRGVSPQEHRAIAQSAA